MAVHENVWVGICLNWAITSDSLHHLSCLRGHLVFLNAPPEKNGCASEHHSKFSWKPAAFRVRRYAAAGGGGLMFPCRTRSKCSVPAETPSCHSSADCWHIRWHKLHCYFAYLTVTPAAHCSLFLPHCHLSPITLYYANSFLNGYCGVWHQCCHPSDWRLQKHVFDELSSPAETPLLFRLAVLFMRHSEIWTWHTLPMETEKDYDYMKGVEQDLGTLHFLSVLVS